MFRSNILLKAAMFIRIVTCILNHIIIVPQPDIVVAAGWVIHDVP